MAIQYAPRSGTILLCDFTGIEPEMVKRRPVVLLSSVSQGLCLVVPLSTTPPQKIMPWHYLLRLQEPLPGNFTVMECWAKCDMLAAVSFSRLNLLFKGKDKNGKRIYHVTTITEADLEAIKIGIWSAVSAGS